MKAMTRDTQIIIDALESADDQLRMLSTVLELTANGAEGLGGGDIIKDICGVTRESLANIRATLDEASSAMTLGMNASA